MLNLSKQQNCDDDNIIGKIYLYIKDPNEAKYKYLVKNMKKLVLKSMKIQRIFNMHEFYKNIEEYKPDGKHKVIVFDGMIADMISNKKNNQLATELFKGKHFYRF